MPEMQGTLQQVFVVNGNGRGYLSTQRLVDFSLGSISQNTKPTSADGVTDAIFIAATSTTPANLRFVPI